MKLRYRAMGVWGKLRSRRRILRTGAVALGTLAVVALAIIAFQTLGDSLFATTLHREVLQPSEALRTVSARSSTIIAMRRTADGSSPLLLFLPATGSSPKLYASFETTAADSGYHVIALPYANHRTERSICLQNADCYEAVRDEQLSGTKTTYMPETASKAAVQATLVDTLQKLSRSDPDGGWDGYIARRSIKWSNIVVSGHSQGGGLAAYIAHQYDVKGVIMFSSPNDVYLPTKTSGTWVSEPSATPSSRYYGLTDIHDFYAPSTTAVWHAMLPQLTVQKSDGVKQYSGQLFSTAATHFPEHVNPHFAVATTEMYQPLWQYFLEKLY